MSVQYLGEILTKTVVFLFVSYLPVLITLVLAWVVVSQLYFKNRKTDDAQQRKSSTTTTSTTTATTVDGKTTDKSERHASSTSTTTTTSTLKTGHHQSTVAKKTTKQQHQDKWSYHHRDSKQNFSHEWLLTSLKGHTGTIQDMDFSANGKYLATCANDDPGGTSGSSSGSEGNKENASPGRCMGGSTLSRRQKKNRVRNASPPIKSKTKKAPQANIVLRQYAKLNLNDNEVYLSIFQYTLRPEDLFALGYPVESKLFPGRALIFKNAARPFDVHAKEFVPRDESVYATLLVNSHNGVDKFDSAEQVSRRAAVTSDEDSVAEEKRCVRCQKSFFIAANGEYLTHEHCIYHWGKLIRHPSGGGECHYSCCKARRYSKGCSTAKLHVWTGVGSGRNGPFDGYVRTRPRKVPPSDGNYGVYALDCEMCYTTTGLELAKISVVASDGRLVYDTFVKPESFIIDYNTRFSGVTAKDLNKKAAKQLKEVQNDLMGFITADTILVGHGLENDLRALRMIHTTVVDTSIVFPHAYGLPYRRSLKSLVKHILKRDVQDDATGHDSCEDARSSLELVLWKVRKDLLAAK